MPKPFANSAQITYSLVNGDWLLGIQTGNSTGDAGLPQMKHIKLSQLSDWVRGTYGQIWRYRGPFSASLPSDAQFNDYFLATATFTVDGMTYTKDHLYAYNASGTWDDISDILTQYASQAQVTDIDDRLTVAEEKIDSMGDGIVYKGEVATYADLAGIVDPQTGWEYYVTADAAFYVYNGASWDQIDNGIVQTITDGDTTHAPSGDAVYDALASEASARTAADSNLKDAIRKDEARITNLEEKADPTGAYKTVNYRGTNDVPPNKAKYALVESIVGKSRAWNQVVSNGNFESTTGWNSVRGSVSATSNVGKYEVTGTPAPYFDCRCRQQNIPSIQGHKYLIYGYLKSSVAKQCGLSLNGCDAVIKTPTANTWELFYAIRYCNTGFSNGELSFGFEASPSVGDTLECKTFIVRDLTLIFPEGVPATVAECVAKCPDLLTYDAYGYSLVDTVVEGVKSVGVNIWDEEWEVGTISQSTGENSDNNNTIRSEGYIPVTPSTNYSPYVNGMPMYHIGIFYYDYNKNFISYDNPNNTTKLFQTPSGCFYIRFACSVTYGSTYNHNIAIAQSDTALTQYYPYMTDTLSLPSPVTLRSAGSVADTDELNVEVLVDGVKVNRRRQTTRISRSYDLSTLAWSPSATVSGAYYATFDVGYKFITNVPALFDKYQYIGTTVGTSALIGKDNVCALYCGPSLSTREIYIKDTSLSSASQITGHIQFELETYVETLSDPIIDNTIQTEGGGTIETIQTQTPVIDNCMDVGYLAL